jgi:hypothetical protein
LTVTCLTQTALAQPKHLPDGERINPGAGDPLEKQCYSSSAFIQLLELDNNHSACLKSNARLKEAEGYYKEIQLNLKKVIEAKDDNILILKKDNDRIHKMWKDENRKRHEAENKPNIGSWLGWSIAGVSTVAVAVLLAVVVLDD